MMAVAVLMRRSEARMARHQGRMGRVRVGRLRRARRRRSSSRARAGLSFNLARKESAACLSAASKSYGAVVSPIGSPLLLLAFY